MKFSLHGIDLKSLTACSIDGRSAVYASRVDYPNSQNLVFVIDSLAFRNNREKMAMIGIDPRELGCCSSRQQLHARPAKFASKFLEKRLVVPPRISIELLTLCLSFAPVQISFAHQ